MKPFEFFLSDNISPNNCYYFKLKTIECLNPSAFGSKIAFYNSSDELLYHNRKPYAHELHDPESIKRDVELLMSNRSDEIEPVKELRVASWSNFGDMVYILEHSHDFKGNTIYTDVVIDLAGGYCWRLQYKSLTDDIVTRLGLRKGRFEELAVKEVMWSLSVPKEPLIRDRVSNSIFSKKWYK